MSALHTRHVQLDGDGAGTVRFPPCHFAGADTGGTITIEDSYGGTIHASTATPYYIEFGSMLPVTGGLEISGGTPDVDCVLAIWY